jgi:hypothetical protein
MYRTGRAELLRCLEAADVARDRADGIQQSSAFVFRNGRVLAFNEEILCKARTGLPKEFFAVVAGGPLLEVLRRMGGPAPREGEPAAGDQITLAPMDGYLKVRGAGRRWAKIGTEKDLLLPLDEVGRPGVWHPLPGEFAEAVKMVQESCAADDKKLIWNCVRLAPGWVEASDSWQFCRYELALPVEAPVLVRRKAAKHAADTGMSEVSDANGWVHFRNGSGLLMSCQRYEEDYPDAAAVLATAGDRAVLPKSLAADAEFAEIFSAEYSDDNKVTVDLRPGELRLTGVGVSGRAGVGPVRVKYKGRPLAFRVGPKILAGIVSRHTEVSVSEKLLKAAGRRWAYVTTVFAPHGKNGEAKKGAPGES